jgi:hypothetical protein
MKTLWIIPLLCSLALGQGVGGVAGIGGKAGIGGGAALGGPAVYDASSVNGILANPNGSVSTTVGTGLSAQGLFLFPALNDAGPYYIQAGGVITTNSSGLVPLNWQQVGVNKTGNGAYHGQCWMATGGGTFSGATKTSFQLTGTTTNPAEAIQYSFSHVNQAAISSAGSATCTSATSGAQAVTLASTTDIAAFSDYDTNSNRTVTGCTTTTDLSAFTTTGYSGTHCSGSTSESATWSGYTATSSLALAQAVPHDDGSSAPACTFEGYNSFTGGTNGTNAAAGGNPLTNLSTLLASQNGNAPGTWTGAGTLVWDTTHYTPLLGTTATLCGDLSTHTGTTTAGLMELGTGAGVINYLNFNVVTSASIPNASATIKICSDTVTTNVWTIDVAKINIGSDYVNVGFQCNGATCWLNIETTITANTNIYTYPTGNSCATGGSGWVTLAFQMNEAGNTACSGAPCSYVKVYNSSGSLVGTGTGQENGTWSGNVLLFTTGHTGSQAMPSGTHMYYSQNVQNYQGTFPPDR